MPLLYIRARWTSAHVPPGIDLRFVKGCQNFEEERHRRIEREDWTKLNARCPPRGFELCLASAHRNKELSLESSSSMCFRPRLGVDRGMSVGVISFPF